MIREVEDYVKRCEKCQMNKLLRPVIKVPMEVTTTASQPFKKCALDITGPLVKSILKNKYMLTFQDELSRFVVAVPVEQQSAQTVTKEFIPKIILKFGTPK
jgi:hypothetical protein